MSDGSVDLPFYLYHLQLAKWQIMAKVINFFVFLAFLVWIPRDYEQSRPYNSNNYIKVLEGKLGIVSY